MSGTGTNSQRDARMKTARLSLPDGIGGTITGGSMPPLDVPGILGRARLPRLAPPIAFGGAVSGAARSMDGFAPAIHRGNRGIALSDGSRIIFSSVGDMAERADA